MQSIPYKRRIRTVPGKHYWNVTIDGLIVASRDNLSEANKLRDQVLARSKRIENTDDLKVDVIKNM